MRAPCQRCVKAEVYGFHQSFQRLRWRRPFLEVVVHTHSSAQAIPGITPVAHQYVHFGSAHPDYFCSTVSDKVLVNRVRNVSERHMVPELATETERPAGRPGVPRISNPGFPGEQDHETIPRDNRVRVVRP